MKTKQIVLYAEQIEACKDFFAKATQEAAKGNPGAVVAQVIKLNGLNRGILMVNYLDGEAMNKLNELMGITPGMLPDHIEESEGA